MARVTLDDKAFSSYDENGNLNLVKGKHEVLFSSSAPFPRAIDLGATHWKSVTIEVK